MDATEQLKRRWETLRGQLNERQRRLFVAAQVLGRGGISLVHRITGVSETTISTEFATQTGLIVHVRHLPPGTSQWNKIEHRLFYFITMNWYGKPLIANTTSTTGLKGRAELDTALYPKGIKIPKDVMRRLPIERDEFHAEWNYTIWPGDTRFK